MISTAQLIRSSTAPAEGSAAEVRQLFTPNQPSSLSVVFNVTTDGYLIRAGALEAGTVLRVEMLVGGTYSALRLKGEPQELSCDNNALKLNTPGRYRLRVMGAQNAGSAVVEGSSLRDWQ